MGVKKELEIEFKSIVSKEKFDFLEMFFDKNFKDKKQYEQINYYFDTTDNILNKLGITLRLRNKKGTWEKTIKISNKNKGNYKENIEINEEISSEKAKEILENGFEIKDEFLVSMINSLGLKNYFVYNLGSLKTIRKDYECDNGDIISLDENYYNNIVDYELEWETKNVKEVEEKIRNLGVAVNNGKGKRKRFLKTLK